MNDLKVINFRPSCDLKQNTSEIIPRYTTCKKIFSYQLFQK